MLLPIDGSHHRWFQDERRYDLIVILGVKKKVHSRLVNHSDT